MTLNTFTRSAGMLIESKFTHAHLEEMADSSIASGLTNSVIYVACGLVVTEAPKVRKNLRPTHMESCIQLATQQTIFPFYSFLNYFPLHFFDGIITKILVALSIARTIFILTCWHSSHFLQNQNTSVVLFVEKYIVISVVT